MRKFLKARILMGKSTGPILVMIAERMLHKIVISTNSTLLNKGETL